MSDPYATTHEDWDPAGDAMPDELRDELAAPNVRKLVDPRTLPARFHHLRAAGQSGAHCLHAFQGENADSLAKRLGSGAHALLFGKPCETWRQPAKKNPAKIAPRSGDAWKLFQAEHAGKVILTIAEHDHARRMCDVIHGHAIAERLLFGPGMVYEQPIMWAEHGRARQSTPDARGPSHNVELKTTRCAAPWRFARDAANMGYHAQLADQRAAIAYERGNPPRESYIVAVENVPPYVVQVYELPPTTLELGDKLRGIWFEKLQIYEATGMWGGYSPRIEPLEVLESANTLPMIADPEWVSGDDKPSTDEE